MEGAECVNGSPRHRAVPRQRLGSGFAPPPAAQWSSEGAFQGRPIHAAIAVGTVLDPSVDTIDQMGKQIEATVARPWSIRSSIVRQQSRRFGRPVPEVVLVTDLGRGTERRRSPPSDRSDQARIASGRPARTRSRRWNRRSFAQRRLPPSSPNSASASRLRRWRRSARRGKFLRAPVRRRRFTARAAANRMLAETAVVESRARCNGPGTERSDRSGWRDRCRYQSLARSHTIRRPRGHATRSSSA